MELLVFLSGLISFLIAVGSVPPILRLSIRSALFDSQGAPGHVKILRKIPNTGGIAIIMAITIPIIAGAAAIEILPVVKVLPVIGVASAAEYVAGIGLRLPMGATLLSCLVFLHVIGIVDDRRPIPPLIKLLAVLALSTALVLVTDTRLFTATDSWAGGIWLSVLITVLWFGAITNAMNFLDNMDGVCAGVGGVSAAGLALLAAQGDQWFVAMLSAMTLGALLGFLVWNRPPARIFMGDGGSLVIGFLLAFLSVRLTYFGVGDTGGLGAGLLALVIPCFILAVPLYDLVTVTMLRLLQRRSPFLGDQQHLTHRCRARGMGDRSILGLMSLIAFAGVTVGLMLAQSTGVVALIVLLLGSIWVSVLLAWDGPMIVKIARQGAER